MNFVQTRRDIEKANTNGVRQVKHTKFYFLHDDTMVTAMATLSIVLKWLKLPSYTGCLIYISEHFLAALCKT